jgi:hypothetical protein
MAPRTARGMLRVMDPRPRYSRAGLTAWTPVLALILVTTFACSDDKSAKSGQAEQSTGNESTYDHAKRGVNQAHEDFKQGIQPTAGWVDDRSHEVADEAVNAADKGKKTLSGDNDHEHDHDSK